MERSQVYSGTITAEQFLFYEIRIASKYYLDGVPVEAAIEEIKENTRKDIASASENEAGAIFYAFFKIGV